jgi:hypothetical protein
MRCTGIGAFLQQHRRNRDALLIILGHRLCSLLCMYIGVVVICCLLPKAKNRTPPAKSENEAQGTSHKEQFSVITPGLLTFDFELGCSSRLRPLFFFHWPAVSPLINVQYTTDIRLCNHALQSFPCIPFRGAFGIL